MIEDPTPKFRLIVQKGSLNNPEREGYTAWRLFGAGFQAEGYYPGEEETRVVFRNFPHIEGIVSVSQRAPELLYNGDGDALIAGADCITEWAKRGKPTKKVMDLGYGGARVVIGVSQDRAFEVSGKEDFYTQALARSGGKVLECHTEMPYIARDDIMASAAYTKRFSEVPPVMVGTTGDQMGNGSGSKNDKVLIKHIDAHAEAEIDLCDYIVERTQRGDSFREAGIIEVGEIMKSEAGLYTTEGTLQDPWRKDMLDYFAWMIGRGRLKTAPVRPEEMVFVRANVREDQLAGVKKYVEEGNFCKGFVNVIPGERNGGRAYSIEMEMKMEQWPMFTHGIWGIKREQGEDAVTETIRLPVLQSLP